MQDPITATQEGGDRGAQQKVEIKQAARDAIGVLPPELRSQMTNELANQLIRKGREIRQANIEARKTNNKIQVPTMVGAVKQAFESWSNRESAKIEWEEYASKMRKLEQTDPQKVQRKNRVGSSILTLDEFIRDWHGTNTPRARWKEIQQGGFKKGMKIRRERDGKIFLINSIAIDCRLILKDDEGKIKYERFFNQYEIVDEEE
ncbi:MAG: hypothetical protein ABID45_01535 [Patescibacteria group bacterium]